MSERPQFAFGLRTAFALSAFFGGGLFVFLLLPGYGSNCGGNSAALTACRCYTLVLERWASEHPKQTFRYDEVDVETKDEWTRLPGADWLQSAKFLARRTEFRFGPNEPKQIVVVCDRAYDNVPQRMFGRAPLAHAAGYSNGEVGLISPAEFAALNLNDFVALETK